jgi:coenzyme F420 biosynthesis associated uncharacterized protein
MSEGVPWDLASRIAARVAGTYPLADGYHGAVLAETAPEMVRRSAELVEAETGLSGGGQPEVAVVGRPVWVERNLSFFAELLRPAGQQIEESLAEAGTTGGLSKRFMAAEMGALLGVLSRRVLGQYELVLPSDERGDVVYLVAPNILMLEREHQFKPSEFRFWIALHEVTHRLQFVGVPWLRDYFFGLVSELVAQSKPEGSRLARLVSEVRDANAEGRPLIGEAGLLGLMATPTQRDLLDKVQALMSLLEGHGHVVMDRVGERHLTTQGRMSSMLKRRRQDPRTAALLRLTGMEMKMKQYELGEKFVKGVEAKAGWSAVDLAWTSVETLPTKAEIEDPDAWLTRVG